jgi:hypothetical protein
MNCPGSVALIGDESSEAGMPAMKGTAAHKVIETMIGNDQHEARDYFGYWVHVKKDGDEETELYPTESPDALRKRAGWFAFLVDEDMVNGVQATIDAVDRFKEEMFKPEVIGERFLDMSWLDDRLGGTADVTLVEPFGWAHLIDHKNGYVIVDVHDNEQMKNYAVGILHEHDDCEGVRVTISQPNAPHEDGTIRTEEYTRDELKLFEIQMKKAADATAKPNAPLRVGDWCQWCPAKNRCKAFDEAMAEEAGAEFSEDPQPGQVLDTGDLDNVAELARKAKFIPLFDQWARDIEGAIQRNLENGVAVPGKKLVHGKSSRKFIDTTEVEQRINAEVPGFVLVGLWTEPEFKSPAQVEKLGEGKDQRKLIKKIVSEMAVKSPGKLTVADDTDPRAAVDPAEEAATEFAADDAEIGADE